MKRRSVQARFQLVGGIVVDRGDVMASTQEPFCSSFDYHKP
jgi:hypothetical protein